MAGESRRARDRGCLFELGEERFARRIARAIVAARAIEPILSTASSLASSPPRCDPRTGKHPATRTFQAIRIHVNRELEQLEQALRRPCGCSRPADGSA